MSSSCGTSSCCLPTLPADAARLRLAHSRVRGVLARELVPPGCDNGTPTGNPNVIWLAQSTGCARPASGADGEPHLQESAAPWRTLTFRLQEPEWGHEF